MADTTARTLRLLSLLQSQRHWSGPDLADRLEVSVRTLRRDVDRLRGLGYPVEANVGVGGGYSLAAGAALPPPALDDDEAVALAVGLQAATAGAVTGMPESSVRALTKLAQVMPPRLRRRVDALRAMTVQAPWTDPGPNVPTAVLTTLAQACRDDERLAFAYTAASGERTERTVEPHRLVPLGRRWYLVAYDLARHDWRSFRLDRLQDPRSLGQAFRQRELPAPDAAAFVRHGPDAVPAPYAVEAVVEAACEVVRGRLGPWADVEPLGAGRSRVRMRTEKLDWAAFALGSAGAEFTVAGPPELLDLLADWSGRYASAVAATR